MISPSVMIGALSTIVAAVGVGMGGLLVLWTIMRLVAGMRSSKMRRGAAGSDGTSGLTAALLRRLERASGSPGAVMLASRAAVRGLAKDELDRMVVALLSQPRPPYRLIAAMVDRTQGPEASSQLFARILCEHHPRLRQLGVVGFDRASSVDPALRFPLAQELASDDADRRVAAVWPMLATFVRDADPPPAVLRTLVGDADRRVRAAAAAALARWEAPAVVTVVASLLTDREWEVRHAAARTLAGWSRLGPAALGRMLASPDRFAQDTAHDALRSRFPSGGRRRGGAAAGGPL